MTIKCKLGEHLIEWEKLFNDNMDPYIADDSNSEEEIGFYRHRINIPDLGVSVRLATHVVFFKNENCEYYDECEERECDDCDSRDYESSDAVALYELNEADPLKYLGFQDTNSYYGFFAALEYLMVEFKNYHVSEDDRWDELDCEIVPDEVDK